MAQAPYRRFVRWRIASGDKASANFRRLPAIYRRSHPAYRVANVFFIAHRSRVLSSAAKELEFAVCSMSASLAGYGTRSASAILGVKRLAREDAWEAVAGKGRDEWGVIEILRRASLTMEESS